MSKIAYNISLKGYVGGYDFDRATVDKEGSVSQSVSEASSLKPVYLR